MAWSPNYCLSCEGQTTEETYCSPACRLAELERGSIGPGTKSTPDQTLSESWLHVSRVVSCPQTRTSAFSLAPPIDFAAYRSGSSRPSTLAAVKRSSLSKMETTEFWDAFWTKDTNSPKSTDQVKAPLTASTSHSSLNSIHSSNASHEGDRLSDQNRAALRAYADSFDRVRDWRRRVTIG